MTIKDRNGLAILAHDEYMRPGTDMQALGALKPAFREMGEVMPGFDKVALMKYPQMERVNHIHHAGNSSGIVDGAAAILIGCRGEKLSKQGRADFVQRLLQEWSPTGSESKPAKANIVQQRMAQFKTSGKNNSSTADGSGTSGSTIAGQLQKEWPKLEQALKLQERQQKVLLALSEGKSILSKHNRIIFDTLPN